MTYFDIVDAIHKQMGEIDMKVNEMAEVLGMDRRTISRKLSHKDSAMKGDQLIKALHEVGLDIVIVEK